METNLFFAFLIPNIILYAYPKGEHENISLTAKKTENQLLFVLTDTGKEFDPTLMPDADVNLAAEDRQIGGLGIFLIRQIMNQVEYQRIDGRNVLTLGKDL